MLLNFTKKMVGSIVCLICLSSVGLAQTLQTNNSEPSTVETDIFSDRGELQPIKPVGGAINGQTPNVKRGEQLPSTQSPNSAKVPEEVVPLFGSQLFANYNTLDKSLDVNGNYEISTGDRIAVRMWGAREYENILTVDVQGNIFLPEIGPIKVAGVPNSALGDLIKQSVSEVFTSNVKIYSNLLGTQPIGVFVTGAVQYPGRYPGSKNDTLLYYLARAGGIDEDSGSYRLINVIRAGKQLEVVDLYRFLLAGEMPNIVFEDNDTIVVAPQFPIVTVTGDVKKPYRYEYDPNTYSAKDILSIAGPKGKASHVIVEGKRGEVRVSEYLTLNEISNMKVFPGDDFEVVSDQASTQILISVEGNNSGASTLSLDKSVLLGQAIKLVEINPQTHDLNSIYIRRKSVADRQKRAIEQSLYELQRSVLTGSSSSSTGSAIRVQEAQLIDRFVQQARLAEPEGRVVLSGSDWQNIHLEEGDEIVIPERTEVVYISGEVKVPQTVIWRQGYLTDDYIREAGGISNRGDSDRLVIIRRDGSVQDGEMPIQKGDHIMVLPEIDSKLFAMFKDLIEITYRVALSAAVVLNATD